MEELLEKTDSIYKLVILAAKRAVELNSGAGKLIEASPNIKLSTLALEEIRQGKIKLKKAVIAATPAPTCCSTLTVRTLVTAKKRTLTVILPNNRQPSSCLG